MAALALDRTNALRVVPPWRGLKTRPVVTAVLATVAMVTIIASLLALIALS